MCDRARKARASGHFRLLEILIVPLHPMQTQIYLAQSEDIETLLVLLKAYYAFDRLHFDERIARLALNQMIGDKNLGRLWIISDNGQEVGYIAITFGFSLEFGGQDAFIDEFFILEDFRGKGIGTTVLESVESALKELKISALHLEVDRDNLAAQKYYRTQGFESRERFINMSKALT